MWFAFLLLLLPLPLSIHSGHLGELSVNPFNLGSTAIAAEACERKWIGLDISKDYCKVARKRIVAHRRILLL